MSPAVTERKLAMLNTYRTDLIVHVYEKIDWRRVQEAMPVILRDVSDFISEVTTRLLKNGQQRL